MQHCSAVRAGALSGRTWRLPGAAVAPTVSAHLAQRDWRRDRAAPRDPPAARCLWRRVRRDAAHERERERREH